MDKYNEKISKNYYHFIIPTVLFSIISLIVLATYSEVLIADFVMWDDHLGIFNNPNFGEISLEFIYRTFKDVDSLMRYTPLTLISWNIIYNIFGLNPMGYHLTSWVYHALSSGLLFLIIRQMLSYFKQQTAGNTLKDYWFINITAVIATLFWAVHPLRVEPVAWAIDLTYCQAVFFLFLSALCYIQANSSDAGIRLNRVLIVYSVVFYIVSLLSHPIGITYFAILLILDIYFFKRIGGDNGWWKFQGAKRVLIEKVIFALPAVLLATITVIIRIKSAGVWYPPVPLSEFDLLDRFMQAFYILAYYAYRPLYIADLSPVYSTLVNFDPLSLPFLLRAFFVISVSIVLFVFRKRWPFGFALWLSHIILLIPVLGVFEHPHYHADRYSLLSSICLSLFIGFSLISLKNKIFYIAVSSVMALYITGLGWLSFNQTKVWNNTASLFTHAIDVLGDDPYLQDIYWRLGAYFYISHKEKKAIRNFEKTLEINPYHSNAHRFLAEIADENGDFKKVAFHLQNILITEPDNAEIHYQLSLVLKELNAGKEASFTGSNTMDMEDK